MAIRCKYSLRYVAVSAFYSHPVEEPGCFGTSIERIFFNWAFILFVFFYEKKNFRQDALF